jgi:Bacterial low temperature requirement A protein (LtrA)
VIAIGVGAGFTLTAAVIGGAALGVVVISALWRLYFDVAAIFARRELVHAEGVTQARLARDPYTYLHLPMVAGIVFFAFALETTLHHITALRSRSVPAPRSTCSGTLPPCGARPDGGHWELPSFSRSSQPRSMYPPLPHSGLSAPSAR